MDAVQSNDATQSEPPSEKDTGIDSLDTYIRSVLCSDALTGEEKCILIHSASGWLLYKKDELNFKLEQFKFETQEDNIGKKSVSVVVKSEKKRSYWKYIPTIAGPVVGSLISAVLKWW
jgi:hypothetical protein